MDSDWGINTLIFFENNCRVNQVLGLQILSGFKIKQKLGSQLMYNYDVLILFYCRHVIIGKVWLEPCQHYISMDGIEITNNQNGRNHKPICFWMNEDASTVLFSLQ